MVERGTRWNGVARRRGVNGVNGKREREKTVSRLTCDTGIYFWHQISKWVSGPGTCLKQKGWLLSTVIKTGLRTMDKYGGREHKMIIFS